MRNPVLELFSKMYHSKCTTEFSKDAPWWSPSEGLQYSGWKWMKTSVIYYGYLKGSFLSFELANIHIVAFLVIRAFQTSKKHAESMFSCTWQTYEQTPICHILWKNLNFKLLYFRNKARYRVENMQADTFLKCLSRDEDKNGNVSLLLSFSFYDVTWKPSQ